jgi:hypothetical protein
MVWSCATGPMAVNLVFVDRSRYFSFKYLLIYPHEAELTPFHTHCYSQNLVAPGIELGTSLSIPTKFHLGYFIRIVHFIAL